MRPGFDDKVLADWNGLMIAALANAADAFDQAHWLAAAEAAFNFVSTRMNSDGRLLHAYREGRAKAPASASDYANMIGAALALANVTGNAAYIAQALAWTDVLDRHYWSDDLHGYYFAADDTSDLILRPFSTQDDATPNANAVMVSNLMALYLWTGEERYRARAEAMLHAACRRGRRECARPCGAAHGRAGRDRAGADRAHRAGGRRCARAAPRAGASIAAGRRGAGGRRGRCARSLPPSSPAHGKTVIDRQPTAYVCIGPQCSLPVTEPAALVET